jgi:hypothetical protein
MAREEYVPIDEVKRVCARLGIRDWTTRTEGDVRPDEAEAILGDLHVEGMDIPLETFRQGLEVELEHGTRFDDANVTNNHPLLTGKIVLAHLKESMDYYARLEVAEIEGDLLKAAVAGNPAKVQALYRKLLAARHEVSRGECDQLQ